MKKILSLLVILSFTKFVFSQNVGINNPTPDPSSVLDITSNNKGLLIPRLYSWERNSISNPAYGLLVFDKDLNSFCFWDNTTWQPIMTDNNGWKTTGNSGTNPFTKFLGTIDSEPLIIKVSNTHAGSIQPGGQTFLGLNSGLNMNNSSANNTAVGGNTLTANTFGNRNSAFGMYALFTNTTGSDNSASGNSALFNNSTGEQNTANGSGALSLNTTGSANTASGFNALTNNFTANYNSAFGSKALQANSYGEKNTALGYSTLANNTIGLLNSAYGNEALYSNTMGHYNAASGALSLYLNTEGIMNTANGYRSLYFNTTGSYNTSVGSNAGPFPANLNNTTCIGADATVTGNDMVRIGNTYVSSIGGEVGWTTLSDGRFKENIKENVPGLDFINKLRPVTYNVNRKKINEFTGVKGVGDTTIAGYYPAQMSETTTGFVAQEVEAAAKSVGFDFSGVDKPKNEKDYYGLRYDEFVVPIVKSIQEISGLNEEKDKTIKNLEESVNKLQKQNAELTSEVIEMKNMYKALCNK